MGTDTGSCCISPHYRSGSLTASGSWSGLWVTPCTNCNRNIRLVFQRSSCTCSVVFILFRHISCIGTGFTCILRWSSSPGSVGCSVPVTSVPWSNPVYFRRTDDRCTFSGYVPISGYQEYHSSSGHENCPSRSGDINRIICLLCNRSS